MRILQVLPELNVGGVETGTVDLAKFLVQNGHTSVVVSNGGDLVKGLEADGSTHYCLPVHKKSLWTMISSVRKLREIIRKERVDIVHARSRVPAWVAYFACRKTTARFLTTCHGYYQNKWFSQVMGWSKIVIVPSKIIGRHMIEDFGVAGEDIRYIPRSVDLTRFKGTRSHPSDPAKKIVTIVGRLTPLKGHPHFLRAMAKVIRTDPYLQVRIIGDAPRKKPQYRQELEMLAKRLGIGENVEFLGNREDVPQLLAESSVVVLSTVTQEAFGRVILEAQAAGVPVVATRVGGVVDIIDHEETGLLVMPRDEDAMAKEVIRFLNEPKLARKCVAAARKKLLDNFTLEHMAAGIIAVYHELMAREDILLIKLRSIGDVVLVTAALKALRKAYPEARLHCCVSKAARSVLQYSPYLDDLIIYDEADGGNGWATLWRLGRSLRKRRFDLVIDFQNNRKSHLLCFLSGARRSVGYGNRKWGFLLTDPVANDHPDLAAVDHQFYLLGHLGIPRPNQPRLELWPGDPDKRCVNKLFNEAWLGNAKDIVGINIAASERWKTKNWPEESIAMTCDSLAASNIRVILTGLPADKDKALRIVHLCKSKPANFVGKTTLMQLAEVIRRCQVYISLDSAPLHVAAAMKTPIVALFGPTAADRHMPPAKDAAVIQRSLSCQPCYSPRCKIKTHECMTDIAPEEVVRKVQAFITAK